MPRQKIGFAFTIARGPNAGLTCGGWRIWTSREDTYITAKHLGGVMKASLHADDAWRIAITKEYQLSKNSVLPASVDRALWKCAPTQFVRGERLAFAIAVTRQALFPGNLDVREAHIAVEDDWNQVTVAYVRMTEPGVGLSNIDRLVGGPLTLESGRQVWVNAGVEHVNSKDQHPAVGSMIKPLLPEVDGVAAPGFLLCGVRIA